MASPASYRGESGEVERLPPRRLAWKSNWSGPGGVLAWLFVGFGVLIAGTFTLVGLPSVVAPRAFGETRDAEIVGVELGSTNKRPAFSRIRFTHEREGRTFEGIREVDRDQRGVWPPGIPVSAGERSTVSCFSLGPLHADDLALPRESAFHRRATDIVGAAFAALLSWAWVLIAWVLGVRPAQSARALFRDGVLVAGRVHALEIIQRGGNESPRRRVRYSFRDLGGAWRNATCEALDADAFAALRVDDVVNVVYDHADPARSHVYEVGPFVFAGAAHPLSPPALLEPR